MHAESVLPAALPDERTLAGTRRTLRLAMCLAVLLPAVLVGAMAYRGWNEAERAVDERLNRTANVALEHALKVFETNRQLLSRVDDYVAQRDDAALRRDEPAVRQRLADFVAGIPQLSSVEVVGADGRLLASSRSQPVSRAAIEQPDLARQRHDSAPIHITAAAADPQSGDTTFDFSMPRSSSRPGRGFNGVISLAMRPAYFVEQYERSTRGTPGLAIALFHRDGAVLARAPRLPASARLATSGTLMSLIQSGRHEGLETALSTLDGSQRRVLFRRIGDYPVYLAVTSRVDVMRAGWLRDTALLALCALVPSALLCWALFIALQRLKHEQVAWTRYHGELDARHQVEAVLRQSRKLEAIGQVTGGISHDFNNLLMVVGASTQVLKKLLAGQPEVERPLAALERAVNSGRHLTRQLLAFARRQPLRPQSVDLRYRMQDFTDLLRATLGARVQLKVSVSPRVPRTVVDEAELELAMLNVALNARDAMPEGGSLTISADAVELDGSGLDGLRGRFVELSFEDNGKGISREHLGQVFQPFWTSKPAGQGTGLGLSQVHGFCQQAGGGVYIESSLGVGTTVTMLLPAAVPAEDDEPTPEADPVQGPASGRLLLVEDNPDVAQSTRALLESMGYRVEAAASGEEALQRLDAGLDCDIVLSDMLMPGRVSGLALAQQLRRESSRLPVLLMTGYTPELEAARQGGFAVIAKPFDAAALRSALDEVRRAASSTT